MYRICNVAYTAYSMDCTVQNIIYENRKAYILCNIAINCTLCNTLFYEIYYAHRVADDDKVINLIIMGICIYILPRMLAGGCTVGLKRSAYKYGVQNM
jgi:hypothetical protein